MKTSHSAGLAVRLDGRGICHALSHGLNLPRTQSRASVSHALSHGLASPTFSVMGQRLPRTQSRASFTMSMPLDWEEKPGWRAAC